MLTLTLLVAVAASAQDIPEGCISDPVGVDGVYEAIELAQMSFGAGDDGTFLDAAQYAQLVLPCLQEPLTRRMAADWHRLMGLVALVSQDEPGAQRAFAAARTIEPNYRLPPSLNRESLSVDAAYQALPIEAVATEEILSGGIQLDGRPARERPIELPTLAQVFRDDGSVQQTAWVRPGEPLPDYAIALPTAGIAAIQIEPLAAEPLPTGPRPKHISRPLLGGAGGAIVTSGLLFAAASVSHERFADPATPYADLNGLEKRTNSLTTASAVAGVVGLGLGVGVVATW